MLSQRKIMKITDRQKRGWRKFRASWRDTIILLREFRRPLIWFAVLIFGSGTVFYLLSNHPGGTFTSWAESIFTMVMLALLQSSGEFPDIWYLQAFYFIVPLMGLAIVAQGLTEFGVALFNRRARNREWEMSVASTFSNHIVLIGLGHLGYRVTCKLHEMNEELVVIEKNPNKDLVANVRALGIPVVEDDGSREAAMVSAGIPKARTVILCTQDDALNLKMALKARNLNPNIEVIVRIFEEDFAEALRKQFGFKAFSATGMAAPVFAATAAKVDISSPIIINETPNSLAKLTVGKGSVLVGKRIQQIEDEQNMSLVCLQRDGCVDMHPSASIEVKSGDVLIVLGVPDNITLFLHQYGHQD